MNSQQLIKHRVCLGIFTIGLCLAAIHSACGGNEISNTIYMTASSNVEIVVTRHL